MNFDPNTIQHDDLRGGHTPWIRTHRPFSSRAIDHDFRCEILVVGAGITGSMTAQHLASQGHEVCIIDRETPGLGSTTASTAMLLWEIDRSLSDLTELYGFDRAAAIYRRSLAAVEGLKALVQSHGLQCNMRSRQSLLLAAGDVGSRELLVEHELRQRAGLPGDFLEHRALVTEFGLHREAAIASPGSADADPLLLSQALLTLAVQQGAKLYDAKASAYHSSGAEVVVEMEDGRLVEASQVVLATGYVMPDFVHSDLHKVVSSWAIATAPQQPGSLWRDGALIWEASENYNYARTTTDHRIIIGGEDDDRAVEPDARDRLTPQKTQTLLGKLGALWPHAGPVAELSWSGAFGTTDDGLPLIGKIPGRPRIHAAYGYGGNGITFSYLASRMIAASIAGHNQPWFDDFAVDRDAPKSG